MLSVDLLRTEGADTLSSAHEQTLVFVILLGCFGSCWVQANPPIMWGCKLCAWEERRGGSESPQRGMLPALLQAEDDRWGMPRSAALAALLSTAKLTLRVHLLGGSIL
jgi:hypothetical protein